MARNRTTKYGLRKKLATLAIGATLLAACGTTSQALSGTVESSQRASVIRDPGNPYWFGSASDASNLATSTQSVIRDPDNLYWRGSNALADTHDISADPRRGPR